VVGKNWFVSFVPERVRDQVLADYKRLVPSAPAIGFVYENSILTATGEERLISWHPAVILDKEGKPMGTLSAGEDVTERRRAEQALRASEVLRIQERSALAERQKLARELHDSVSQALYGIALGVNTALTVLDRDREAAREALNYSITLARAGLSEMRALIFELRPESLESEGLVAALLKTAEAVRARFELPVNVETCEEPDLPLAAKEAIYRVAQEALHNAIKHAESAELWIRLGCSDGRLYLEVEDCGTGFDPNAPHPGHLGLKSMRERAASVGGILKIRSVLGEGTCVQLELPTVAEQAPVQS
jgi:signal transduction histidine kinase